MVAHVETPVNLTQVVSIKLMDLKQRTCAVASLTYSAHNIAANFFLRKPGDAMQRRAAGCRHGALEPREGKRGAMTNFT